MNKTSEREKLDRKRGSPTDRHVSGGDEIGPKRKRKAKQIFTPDTTASRKGKQIHNKKNKENEKKNQSKTEPAATQRQISALIDARHRGMTDENSDESSVSPSPAKKNDNQLHTYKDITAARKLNKQVDSRSSTAQKDLARPSTCRMTTHVLNSQHLGKQHATSDQKKTGSVGIPTKKHSADESDSEAVFNSDDDHSTWKKNRVIEKSTATQLPSKSSVLKTASYKLQPTSDGGINSARKNIPQFDSDEESENNCDSKEKGLSRCKLFSRKHRAALDEYVDEPTRQRQTNESDNESHEKASDGDASDSDTEVAKKPQLYGKFYKDENGDGMVHLADGIWCRNKIYQSAKGAARKVPSLIRRLIEGVFIVENIIDCTMTGQAPRAGISATKDKNSYNSCDADALAAIQTFAVARGESKGWEIPSDKEIRRIFTQKIGELKKEWRANQTIKTNKD